MTHVESSESRRITAQVAVELSGVARSYSRAGGVIRALTGVDLEVYEGEFVVVRGAGDSGKSSLLRLIAGLERATTGRVTLLGHDFSRMNDRAIDLFRRQHLGVAMQTPLLIDHLTVEMNVALPLLIGGKPMAEVRSAVAACLDALKIGALAKADARAVSRGEARRIAIARTLVHGPSVVIADNPTADLDRLVAADVIRVLRTPPAGTHRTAVIASNDPDITVFADRIVELRHGTLMSDTGRLVGIRCGHYVA